MTEIFHSELVLNFQRVCLTATPLRLEWDLELELFDDHFGLLTQIASEKISNALLLVLLHIVSLLLHIFVNVTHSLQSFLV